MSKKRLKCGENLKLFGFSELIINLEMMTDVKFPKWVGSYLYKGIRYHLKKLICGGYKHCEKCDLTNTCPYYEIFEKKYSLNKKMAPTRPISLVPPYFQQWKNIEKEKIIRVKLLIFKNIEVW
ncbi:MAG: hypothetical protein ACTSVK_16500, partial [Promethearchaeota archaeon]